MKSYYEEKLKEYMEEYPSIVQSVMTREFGEALSIQAISGLSEKEMRHFYVQLRKAIILDISKYDLKKLTQAIWLSTGGHIGGQAITEYTCLFCKKTSVYGSTAVPKICSDCAEYMATTIILQESDLLKD